MTKAATSGVGREGICAQVHAMSSIAYTAIEAWILVYHSPNGSFRVDPCGMNELLEWASCGVSYGHETEADEEENQ